MAQSMNTKVDLTIKATSYHGLATYGDMMVGDKAVEFYNEKNVEDYVQIPWTEVDHVAASVIGGKHIISKRSFDKWFDGEELEAEDEESGI